MKDFIDILKKLNKKPPPRRNDHVLIVDSLNMFISSFVTINTVNTEGQHVGGLVGFLRSLGLLVRTLNPTRVICVFDGVGSSISKKNINPNYKANRNTTKITKWGIHETKKEEQESISAQVKRVFEYLQTMPVDTLILDKVEADDVISFVADNFCTSGSRVTIVSTDKDFFQIIKHNLNVYNPVKKKLFTRENIIQQILTLPENYLIIKALVGDPSDNLKGVKGLGIKTLVKHFPTITTEVLDLKDIYLHAEQKIQENKMYAKIIDDWDKIKTNYKIMNLQESILDQDEKDSILEELQNPSSSLLIGGFLHCLKQDKIEGITGNTEGWLYDFKYLTTIP